MATSFTHVLCPVDFSDCSRHALDYAAALTRSYGGTLTVLHNMQAIALATDPMLGSVVLPTAEDLDRAGKNLRDFVADEAAGLTIRTEVREGNTVAAILEMAEALPADMLVLGTHGRRGFERFLLGSTTERLLRRAACPVLTVPPRAPDAPQRGPVAFQRILCAMDFSASARAALVYATSLARDMGATLTLMTVIEPMPVPDALSLATGTAPDFEEAARAATEARLRDVAPTDVPNVQVVVVGKPYREILERARADAADLIVIGVHGGGALPGFLGSTTNHVVREASCPVLSLRG